MCRVRATPLLCQWCEKEGVGVRGSIGDDLGAADEGFACEEVRAGEAKRFAVCARSLLEGTRWFRKASPACSSACAVERNENGKCTTHTRAGNVLEARPLRTEAGCRASPHNPPLLLNPLPLSVPYLVEHPREAARSGRTHSLPPLSPASTHSCTHASRNRRIPGAEGEKASARQANELPNPSPPSHETEYSKTGTYLSAHCLSSPQTAQSTKSTTKRQRMNPCP